MDSYSVEFHAANEKKFLKVRFKHTDYEQVIDRYRSFYEKHVVDL